MSEQLASIGNIASDITKEIKNTHNITTSHNEPVLLTIPSKTFVVGKLQAKFPSPVNFFSNRCEYAFHHPYESSMINMVMYYNDMYATRIITKGNFSFSFKIDHSLLHYLKDYDPANRQHFVSIMLNSSLDAIQIKDLILSKVHV